MPTYEYRCPEGHEFETVQRMSDPPVAECPTCGEEAERLLSAGAGFLFKGPGFYITDYRSDAYREQAKKDQTVSSGDPSASKKDASGVKDGASGNDAPGSKEAPSKQDTPPAKQAASKKESGPKTPPPPKGSSAASSAD